MKIFITGASGFIGRHLIKLLSLNHELMATDLKGGEEGDQKIWPLDLLNQKELKDFIQDKEIDGIIHLAALVPPTFDSPESERSYKINLLMTQNLLKVFKAKKIKQFIYLSGTSVYGQNIKGIVTEETKPQPDNWYTKGKYAGELLVQKYEMPLQKIAILRVSAPYGPGQLSMTLISKFIHCAIIGQDLTFFGTGGRLQDFIYVSDVVQAINQAIEVQTSGIFNIASGQSTSVTDLAQTILQILPESKSKIVSANIADPQENYRIQVSIQKAREILKFEPKVKLADGLKEIIEL